MTLEERIRQLEIKVDYLTHLVEVVAVKQHIYIPPKTIENPNYAWMTDGATRN